MPIKRLHFVTLAAVLFAASSLDSHAALAAPTCSASAVSSSRSKADDIRCLLKLTDATARMEEARDEMLRTIRPQLLAKGAPVALVDELEAEFRRSDPTDILVGIYDSQFTAEEIRGLVVFYDSPLGRSLVKKTPSLMAASEEAGKRWGESVARRVFERARSRSTGLTL